MIAIRPNLIITITAIIVFLILLSLAQEMNRRWQVQRETAKLEQQVNDLQNNLVELEHLNQYFKTDDYQERLAREKLNYHAPGEQVVLIPEEDISATENDASQTTNQTPQSNPMLWWRLFFVDRLTS